MNIKEISPDYSVSPQIGVDDVAGIAELGFRSIICNRPDGESPDQTDVALIRAQAEASGLAFAFVPARSGGIQPQNVDDHRAALAALPAPVLAYCRSGARCQNLWLLSR
jgi:uncharacterized protein (TIGR01244 family)